jgi:hypothetical protein
MEYYSRCYYSKIVPFGEWFQTFLCHWLAPCERSLYRGLSWLIGGIVLAASGLFFHYLFYVSCVEQTLT